MSCWKYWPKIEEIASMLESYGIDEIDDLDSVDLSEITSILDGIEV